MSYRYNLYGKIFDVNIKLNLLNEIHMVYDCESVYLNVEFKNISSFGMYIERLDDNVYAVMLDDFAHYIIDIKNQFIQCTARSYETFFSTFFNIPFSVYCILSNEILLHSCVMTNLNESFYCFVGEKGVGKSTLTTLLSDQNLRLYSDDTICMNSHGKAFRGHNYIKYTRETTVAIRESCFKLTDNYNAVGKQYGIIDTKEVLGKVDAIIKINRTSTIDYPMLKEIESKMICKSIFYGNIVGSSYFDRHLLELMYDIRMPEGIRFFILQVPNTLDLLLDNISFIKKDLLEKIIL